VSSQECRDALLAKNPPGGIVFHEPTDLINRDLHRAIRSVVLEVIAEQGGKAPSKGDTAAATKAEKTRITKAKNKAKAEAKVLGDLREEEEEASAISEVKVAVEADNEKQRTDEDS
jgi:hypothetical protein